MTPVTLPGSRLKRFTFACIVLTLLDLVILTVSLPACVDDGEECPSWREWMSLVTYLAALVLAFLALVGLVLLGVRSWRARGS